MIRRRPSRPVRAAGGAAVLLCSLAGAGWLLGDLHAAATGAPPAPEPVGAGNARPGSEAIPSIASGPQLRCTDCHGVPPASGAHAAHANLDGYRMGFDCSLCHYVEHFPALHDNGRVDVRFSPALRGGERSRYENGSCRDVYCHSDARGRARATSWTADTRLGCADCHDDRTSRPIAMSGRHEFHLNSGVECAACHAGVVDLADRLVDHQRHANGRLDVNVLAGDYDTATGDCTTGCHVTRNWREGD